MKKDVDQLGGSIRWNKEQNVGVQSIPIMLHPSRTIDDRGTVVDGMKVVTPAKLEELKEAVRAFAVALADGQGRWGDEQAVRERLSHGQLTGDRIFQKYVEAPIIP